MNLRDKIPKGPIRKRVAKTRYEDVPDRSLYISVEDLTVQLLYNFVEKDERAGAMGDKTRYKLYKAPRLGYELISVGTVVPDENKIYLAGERGDVSVSPSEMNRVVDKLEGELD